MTRIVIAGMHRSGTSLVAGALMLAGVDLGPEKNLMPAKHDNPKGFFENLDVVQINDDLLAQLGGTWQDPALVEDDWHLRPDVQVFRERIRQLVDDQFRNAEHVAWKDPRISLLLPVWVPDADVGEVVLVLRDPREVAQSVMARSSLDDFQAARLYTRYTASLLQAWPRPIIVEYSRFVTDPVASLHQLCERLSLPPPPPESLDAVRELADPSLQHHAPAGVPLRHDMYEALRLTTLLRHAPDLARFEANYLFDRWRDAQDNQPPDVQNLHNTLSVLRERIHLKDEQLLVLERMVDTVRGEHPVAAEPQQSSYVQRVTPLLKHAVAKLPRGGR